MKLDVGLDQTLDRMLALGAAAVLDQFRTFLGSAFGAAGCGEPAGEAFGDGADFVEIADEVSIDRRHFQSASRRLAHKALIAQQQQRLLHGLARHAKVTRQIVLDQAGQFRQFAADNVGKDALIDAFGQIGLGLQRRHVNTRSTGCGAPVAR